MRRLVRSWVLRRLLIIVSLLANLDAHAQLRVEESLEWKTDSANLIGLGLIEDVPSEPVHGEGKRDGLALVSIRLRAVLKGKSKGDTFCIALRNVNLKRLQEYKQNRTELLLFLTEPIQAVCPYELLDSPNDRLGSAVPLSDPSTMILSAATFQILTHRERILSALSTAVTKLERDPVCKPPVSAPQPRYLEVPSQSDLFRKLYRGSSVYLSVPSRLFPQALDSLPPTGQSPSLRVLNGQTVIARLESAPPSPHCGKSANVSPYVYTLHSLSNGQPLSGRIVVDVQCPELLMKGPNVRRQQGACHAVRLAEARPQYQGTVAPKSPDPTLPRYQAIQISSAE